MRVNLIGTGNIAQHLASALHDAGHVILSTMSLHFSHTLAFAQKFNTTPISSPSQLPQADITILAIPDNAIPVLAPQLPNHTPIAHTSGATPLDALLPHEQRAVLYPCQTFSASDDIDFSQVPLLIEASDSDTLQLLQCLASSLSRRVLPASSPERATLHLAATIASNFTNHLLLQSQQLISQTSLPTDILNPLILQTVHKALTLGPHDAQTGPARRNDSNTIQHHLDLISNPLLKQIYQSITHSISATYHNSCDS